MQNVQENTVLVQAEPDTAGNRHNPQPIDYKGRYCIIGAGPSGLLAARAFKLAGIPYDQFERHEDVGGIWDIDSPGSPMYDSAHFISSKYTSGFFGLPMPAEFPDYPDHRQILAYIRDFTDAFGLREQIRFGVAVEHAEPIGVDASDGWKVTLATGEVRVYRGLVCAPGVTWHPNMPDYPGIEDFKGEVRHSVDYRSARDMQDKSVLIVGAGNSGVDIACDAAQSAREAFISLRRGYWFVPKHIFGLPSDAFVTGLMEPPKGVVIPEDLTEMLEMVVGDLTRYGLPAPDHKAFESHPIMNTQILHYLAHGDIKAKPAVQRFTETGVVFADGTEQQINLVLFATGYDYLLPYLDEQLITWNQGHPELYLNIFHRKLKGLAVVGFVEFASAAYQRFDEMAQLVAMDAYIETSGIGREEWVKLKAEDCQSLRGPMNYIDTPRHANYVEVGTYQAILSEIRETFSWPDSSDELYAPMRVNSSSEPQVPVQVLEAA